MSLITFDHVSKSFPETVVFKDLSLTIERGEFVTVIGRSGCGKTTFLKMINALELPDTGKVHVDLAGVDARDAITLRRNIGYAIQGAALFPHLTVRDNIAYVPRLLNGSDRKRTAEAVDKWMDIVGLKSELSKRYPDELSGGQQQRVGIARALAASPEILLMDEPFGAVDELTRAELQKEIARIHRETGITVVFVTHSLEEARLLGTRILVLGEGGVLVDGAPDQLGEITLT